MVPLGSTLSRQAPTSVELDRNGLCPKYFLVLCLGPSSIDTPSSEVESAGVVEVACARGSVIHSASLTNLWQLLFRGPSFEVARLSG